MHHAASALALLAGFLLLLRASSAAEAGSGVLVVHDGAEYTLEAFLEMQDAAGAPGAGGSAPKSQAQLVTINPDETGSFAEASRPANTTKEPSPSLAPADAGTEYMEEAPTSQKSACDSITDDSTAGRQNVSCGEPQLEPAAPIPGMESPPGDRAIPSSGGLSPAAVLSPDGIPGPKAPDLQYKVANVDDPSDPYSQSLLSPAGSSGLAIRCNPVNEFACVMQPSGIAGRYITATSAEVRIENITFTGWTASGGGAVLLRENSTGVFTNVTFMGNAAHYGYMGGAVTVINSTAEFHNCKFVANMAVPQSHEALVRTSGSGANEMGFGVPPNSGKALNLLGYAEMIDQRSPILEIERAGGDGVGGAIAVVGEQSNVLLNNSHVEGNEAQGGGAVFQFRGRVAITGSNFSNNRAEVEGGTIYADEAGWLLLQGSDVGLSSAREGCGGTLALYGGVCTVLNSRVSSSYAGLCGGAVVASSGASAMIIGSSLDNSASALGGCIYALKNSTLLMQNSSVTKATASAFGGMASIDGEATTLRMTSSNLSSAEANQGGGHLAATRRAAVIGLNATFWKGPTAELAEDVNATSAGSSALLVEGSRMWCTGCNITGNSIRMAAPGIDFSLEGGSLLALSRSRIEGDLSDGSNEGLSSIHIDEESFATLESVAMAFRFPAEPAANSSRASFISAKNSSSLAVENVTFQAEGVAAEAAGSSASANWPAAVVLAGESQAAIEDSRGLPGNLALEVRAEDSASKVFMRPATGSGLAYNGATGPETCWTFDCIQGEALPLLCPELDVIMGLSGSLPDGIDVVEDFLSGPACDEFLSTTAYPVTPFDIVNQEQCPAEQSEACSANYLVSMYTCPAVCSDGHKDVPWFIYLISALGALLGVLVLGWFAYAAYFKKWIFATSKDIASAKVELTNLSVNQYPSTDSDGYGDTPSSNEDGGKMENSGNSNGKELQQASADSAIVARVDTSSQIDLDVDFDAEVRPFLTKDNFIGAGGFGEVYKMTYRGRKAAVKVFPGSFCGPSDEQYASYLQELELMGRFQKFPQIVSMWGASVQRPNMGLIYELVEGGSLSHRIHHGLPMTYPEIVKAGHDIALGLSHLHPTVVHRDLKPANILIGADGTCKLIDFGLSRGKDPYVSYITTEAGGTPNYMPPEMFDGSRIDEKVDIYAFGMILYECVMRVVPWSECECMARVIFQVSIQRERPELPSSMPWPLARLIRKCWADEPFKRPSAYEVAKALEFMMEDRIGEAGALSILEDESSTSSGDIASTQEQRTKRILAAAAAAGPEAEEAIRIEIQQELGQSFLATQSGSPPYNEPRQPPGLEMVLSPFLDLAVQTSNPLVCPGSPGSPAAAFLQSCPSGDSALGPEDKDSAAAPPKSPCLVVSNRNPLESTSSDKLLPVKELRTT